MDRLGAPDDVSTSHVLQELQDEVQELQALITRSRALLAEVDVLIASASARLHQRDEQLPSAQDASTAVEGAGANLRPHDHSTS
ncbi:hypothetical protein [Deinococcus sonorensis]|uniref:Uncharacterized protein n=2 Tax=Deinococcus sonorensis TaxID=309891 RepID=A0AAU7U7R6_9DEIO